MKGILKEGGTTGKRRGVMWDEDNLLENEALTEITLKIDDPKTPFHYLPEGDSDSESDLASVNSNVENGGHSPDRLEEMAAGELVEKMVEKLRENPYPKVVKRQSEFERKRAQHYDEGRVLTRKPQ